jgi:hypothetical protein
MNIKKYLNFNNRNLAREGGYAILFAVVVVSIISMIAIGLSNTTYKQLVLSSLANDSQLSYYQSDTSTECALYADNVLNMTSATSSPWSCGVSTSGSNMSFSISGSGANYVLTSSLVGTATPCFDFDVTKVGTFPVATTIYARGYNSCEKTNPKTVEREIKVTY